MRGCRARPRRRIRAGSLAAAALLLAFHAPAAAQKPAAPPAAAPAGAPPPAPAPPAAPQPVPLAEIAAAAESAGTALASFREMLGRGRPAAEIEAELGEARRQLAADRKEAQAQLEGSPPLRLLAELEVRWRGLGDAQRQQVADLGGRVAEAQALRDRVLAIEETWRATLERAREEEAPPEVLARIRSVLADAEATRTAIRERAAALLGLQDQAADLARQVDEVVADLRAKRSSVERSLLEPDKPPLWEALRGEDLRSGLAGRLRATIEADARALADLFGRDWRLLATYGTLLLLSLPVTFMLRARSRLRRAEGRSLGAADWVFDYPISIAILATLPLAWWLVFPDAPSVLLRLFLLLVWVPLVRVLRRLVPEGLRPAVHALAAFFVVDRVRDLLEPAAAGERALFALELAVAIVLLLHLLRPRRLVALPPDARLSPLAGVGMRVAVAALAAALVANLLGFVDLSLVLGQSLFGATYLAVLLFGVARALQLVALGLLRTSRARRLHVVQRHGEPIQHRLDRVIGWLAAGLWLWLALGFFGAGKAAVGLLRSVLAAGVTVGNLDFTLGNLVAFAITVWLALWVSRLLRVILEDEVFPRASLGRGVPHAISAVAQYGVLLIGFLLAAGAAGFDWSRITLLAGAFGVGVGFGLQNVVNNFVSGLILLFERPIQVGDIVQQGELTGEVRRIGVRSSTVRTYEGAEVIVPNADLISQQVVNWTLSDRTRLIAIPVGVAYGTAPERVLTLLDEVARGHADVLADPPPAALFTGFGESSLGFELRVWSERPERRLATRSELLLAIHSALDAAGIEVPFPQRDLRVVAIADAAARALAGRSASAREPDGEP